MRTYIINDEKMIRRTGSVGLPLNSGGIRLTLNEHSYTDGRRIANTLIKLRLRVAGIIRKIGNTYTGNILSGARTIQKKSTSMVLSLEKLIRIICNKNALLKSIKTACALRMLAIEKNIQKRLRRITWQIMLPRKTG